MGKITKNIFLVDNDIELEQSGLYRLLRVLNFIGYGFVLLVVLVAYLIFVNATTYEGNTLTCPDGTKWNIADYTSTANECGLCYHRAKGGGYTACDWSDPHYNDLFVTAPNAPRTYTDGQAFWYSALIGVIGLAILKLVVNTTIYITVGRKT